MENQTVNEGKTNAIICYLTIFGTIIAFILNNSKKNPFTSFHIRQMLGIFLLSIINKYLVYDLLGSLIGFIVLGILVVLWFIGFIGAIKGEERSISIFGEFFQNLFKGIQ